MTEKHEIVVDASIAKVQTMADGGLRVLFDLPETAVKQVSELLELKRQGVAVRISITAIR